MKLSNKAYDIIKWLALVLIPATATLWLTLGKVWAFPYLTEVGATIPAIGLFLAGIIGISTDAYHKELSDALDYDTEAEEIRDDIEEKDEV